MSSQNLKHPRGLYTLFFTEMWERFSYYGMRAILVLYMTTDTAMEGLGLSTETSTAVYGLYTASVYLLALPGGWIADRIIGQRKAIWYGGILIMIGHMILAIPGEPSIFFAGLAFVAFGTGFLKPNISSIVGELYPEGGSKRDAGFAIFYTGINLGAFLGQIIVPILGEKVNWHLGFGAAAVGMFFGLLQYKLTQHHLGDLGMKPKIDDTIETKGKGNGGMIAAVLVVGLIVLSVLHYYHLIGFSTISETAESFGYIIALVTILYFGVVLLDKELTQQEKSKTVVIMFFLLGAAFFWSGFEQAGSSLSLFARDFADRIVFNYELPAGMIQNANSTFIILLSPVVGVLWVKLSAKQLNPSTPIKFAIGLLLLGVGFVMMVKAADIATQGEKAGLFWLVLTYFFHTIGELTLSPIGLSATTKLAPKKYYSQMMGMWFVAAAIGNLIAGVFAGNFDPENVQQMPDLFMSVVYVCIGSSIFFLVMSPLLKKWMHDVK